MASMTCADVITLARTLVDEPDTSALRSAAAVTLYNAANLDVYRRIIDVQPDYFLTSATFAWPASTESLDISGASYLNAVPYKIAGVEVTNASGGTTANNLPTKLTPMVFQERAKYLQDNGYGALTANPTYRPAHYVLTGGSKMYLAPIATSALNMTIYYIPQLVAATTATASAHVPLAGTASEFHDIVAYRLASLVESKQKGSSQTATRLWMEAQDRISASAGSRQVDEPRRVIYKGYRHNG